MKTTSSIALSVLAGLVLMTGCASNRFRPDAALQPNSLLIMNRSHDTLRVEHNGKPWIRDVKGLPAVNPVAMNLPSGSSYILENCSSQPSEEVVLTFKAVKEIQVGCLRGEKQVGARTEAVTVGTLVPGKTIVLTSRDF